MYRLRWQIELAFKRLKSLLNLDRLPARTEKGARSLDLARPENRHRRGSSGMRWRCGPISPCAASKAAESLAIPGEALLQDHDPLEPALPFTNEQRAGLQCDALPSLWGAPVEGDAGAIVLLGAKVPPDRFVEIAESV